MMGGVSPETRWASYKYGIIYFWYIVASCWIFLYEFYIPIHPVMRNVWYVIAQNRVCSINSNCVWVAPLHGLWRLGMRWLLWHKRWLGCWLHIGRRSRFLMRYTSLVLTLLLALDVLPPMNRIFFRSSLFFCQWRSILNYLYCRNLLTTLMSSTPDHRNAITAIYRRKITALQINSPPLLYLALLSSLIIIDLAYTGCALLYRVCIIQGVHYYTGCSFLVSVIKY